MRRRAVALAAALAACVPAPAPKEKHGYSGTPALGAPFTSTELDAQTFTATALPNQTWSWIPFPDSVCADGSATGIAVSPGTGEDLLVFLDGGGACWDYTRCEVLHTAVDDSYGPSNFAIEIQDYFPGSILDRAMLPPTLAGATLVFVPYCTGDIHGGDNVATYTAPFVSPAVWNHVGHPNVMRFLERIAASFPSPRKLVVAGSSAGGFGALANYEAFRWYYPDAQGYLVDDSGPPLVGDDIGSTLRSGWYDAWHLGASLDVFCKECRDDMSAGLVDLSQDHPGDRLAVLSHLDDGVMATFLQNFEFGSALGRLATRLDATSNARVFYDAGTDHMLITPLYANEPSIANQQRNGVTLSAWLEAMVSDDAAWASVR